MNDNSTTNRLPSKMPSDDQMDLLLSSFFRLEVPTELHQPLQLPPLATASLTVVPQHHVEQSRPRTVRLVAIVASVAAMAMSVLLVISTNNSQPSNGHDIANGILKSAGVTPAIDNPMLVSPDGNKQQPFKAISPDGVTLEETDGIDLHPQN